MAIRFIDEKTSIPPSVVTNQKAKSQIRFIDDEPSTQPDISSLIQVPQRFFSPQLQAAQPLIQAGFKKLPPQVQTVIRDVMGGLPITGQIAGDIGVRQTLAATPIPPKLKRFIYGAGGTIGAMAGERARQIGKELIGEGLLPKEAGEKILKTGKTAALIETAGWGLEKILTPLWRITGGKLPFMKRLRGAFLDVKQRAYNKFGTNLLELEKANPNTRIDFSNIISELRDDIFGNPVQNITGDRSILNLIRTGQRKVGSELFEKILNNPELAKNLTLSEARILRQTIEKSPQIANNLTRGKFANWQPGHLNILDTLDNMRATIANAFPDIKGINAQYANFINKYNQIKGFLRTGKLSGALDKGLREVEIWKDFVKPLLKDNPQMLRELTSYFRTQLVSRYGVGALVAGGALLAGKRIIADPLIGLLQQK